MDSLLINEQQYTETLSFYLTKNDVQKIKEAASRQKLSVSAFCRFVLFEKINEEEVQTS